MDAFERDPKSGVPSGVLREDAMALVESFIPNYTKEQIENGLFISVKEANKFGITAILDAGTESINQKYQKRTILMDWMLIVKQLRITRFPFVSIVLNMPRHHPGEKI